jgi:hypothetical protein
LIYDTIHTYKYFDYSKQQLIMATMMMRVSGFGFHDDAEERRRALFSHQHCRRTDDLRSGAEKDLKSSDL